MALIQVAQHIPFREGISVFLVLNHTIIFGPLIAANPCVLASWSFTHSPVLNAGWNREAHWFVAINKLKAAGFPLNLCIKKTLNPRRLSNVFSKTASSKWFAVCYCPAVDHTSFVQNNCSSHRNGTSIGQLKYTFSELCTLSTITQFPKPSSSQSWRQVFGRFLGNPINWLILMRFVRKSHQVNYDQH